MKFIITEGYKIAYIIRQFFNAYAHALNSNPLRFNLYGTKL